MENEKIAWDICNEEPMDYEDAKTIFVPRITKALDTKDAEKEALEKERDDFQTQAGARKKECFELHSSLKVAEKTINESRAVFTNLMAQDVPEEIRKVAEKFEALCTKTLAELREKGR